MHTRHENALDNTRTQPGSDRRPSISDAGPEHVPLDFLSFDQADVAEAWRLIENGIPAEWIGRLAANLSMPEDRVQDMLGLSASVTRRKAGQRGRLPASESSRVLGVYCLIATVDRMVQESGNSDGFNPATWLADWINHPVPTLGDRLPAELLGTREGQQLVWSLLRKMQSGAYS
jgi:putative toxin-antitoxin system antitoxin component (TIGR02293 family)